MPERLISEEEFGAIVIRTLSDGSQVKISDVASVELGVESYNVVTRFAKSECALITLYQAPGTNAVDLASQVIAAMDDMKGSFPEGVDYEVGLDSTLPITAGIKEIVITLLIALSLVILVVFIFIQDIRATLIPTIAIPVSLIGAFAIFPLLGFTINVLSLLGLVLAIGIVVDDAIVVVEAVQVNLAKGMNSKEATIHAMKEVTAPVIATTLVLVAVFIPVASMGGITGRLYQQFAITVAVSVVFSSLNALTLSPALCSLLLKEPKPMKGPLGWFFKKFNAGFDRTSVAYMKFTNILIRKLKRGVVFIVVLTASIVVIGKFVPGGFVPEEDQGYIYVNMQLPDAASLQRSDAVMAKIEGILDQFEEVQYVTAVAGFNLLSGSMSTNSGVVFITLTDWGERDITTLELAKKLNVAFYMGIPDAQVFAFGPPAIPGLGTGAGFTMMLQDKGGNSIDYLSEQATKFIAAANQRPEIGNAFTTFQANTPQRSVEINRDKVLKTGVDLNDLYTTISAFLGGAYVNDFNRFGRLYKAYVQAEPQYRQNEDQLSLFFVKNKDGEDIPLSTLVSVNKISGPEYTYRYNLYRAVEIGGAPAPGYSSTQALDALEEVAAEVLPFDMGYEWSNMSYQEKAAS